jgi:hypothetical protein
MPGTPSSELAAPRELEPDAVHSTDCARFGCLLSKACVAARCLQSCSARLWRASWCAMSQRVEEQFELSHSHPTTQLKVIFSILFVALKRRPVLACSHHRPLPLLTHNRQLSLVSSTTRDKAPVKGSFPLASLYVIAFQVSSSAA